MTTLTLITNPTTFTTITQTLTDSHGAFERFCVQVFCDFVWNYSSTFDDAIDTSKCYSVIRSSIDENNDSVSRNWIVFSYGIVVKLASVAEFSMAEDLAIF